MGLSRKNAEMCVTAIRRNRYIGEGTRSHINHNYEDAELVTELMELCPDNSVHGGLKWMIEIEAELCKYDELMRNGG